MNDVTGKYLEVEKLKLHINAIQQELLKITATSDELDITKEVLDDMKSGENLSDVLIPLGNGVYAFGEIVDRSHIFANVGGLIGKQNLDTAIDFLKKQEKTISDAKTQLENKLNDLTEKLNKLRLEIESESLKQQK